MNYFIFNSNILDKNKDNILNIVSKTIPQIICELEKSKPEVPKWSIILYVLFGSKEKELEGVRDAIQNINTQIKDIKKNSIEILDILNKLNKEKICSNDLNYALNNANDIKFNIETLKYNIDLQKNDFKCEKLHIIYDQDSTANIIQSIREIFSLFDEIELLNNQIDNLNSKATHKTQEIKKIKVQEYVVSDAQESKIRCILDYTFLATHKIQINTKNENILNNASDENLKLILMLKAFYFYANKIKEIYGAQILKKLNIADEKNKEKIQTKIIFDISTIFFLLVRLHGSDEFYILSFCIFFNFRLISCVVSQS